MKSDTDIQAPELRLLAGLRRQHAVPDGDATDRMRHAVLHATAYPPAVNGRAPHRRRLLVGAVAATVALSAAVGVAAAVSHRPAGRTPAAARGSDPAPVATGTAAQAPLVGDRDNAQAVLTIAARSTRSQPAGNFQPGQYLYRKTTEQALAQYSVADDKFLNLYEEQQAEMWLDPRNGLQAVRTVSTTGLHRRPVTAEDAALAARLGFDLNAPPQTSDSDHPVKGGPQTPTAQPPSLRFPTPEYLAGLPTDPAQLLAVLRQAAKAEGNTKWSTDKIAFGMAYDLFAQAGPILPAALCSGLYGAIALMPGIQRIEGQTDLGGRHGIAIGFAERGEREDILLDPTTLETIGDRTVRLTAGQGLPAGVESWSTFTFAIVDQPGKTN
jgi:hypothetical protein